MNYHPPDKKQSHDGLRESDADDTSGAYSKRSDYCNTTEDASNNNGNSITAMYAFTSQDSTKTHSHKDFSSDEDFEHYDRHSDNGNSTCESPLCLYYNTRNGCKYGDRCRFKHYTQDMDTCSSMMAGNSIRNSYDIGGKHGPEHNNGKSIMETNAYDNNDFKYNMCTEVDGNNGMCYNDRHYAEAGSDSDEGHGDRQIIDWNDGYEDKYYPDGDSEGDIDRQDMEDGDDSCHDDYEDREVTDGDDGYEDEYYLDDDSDGDEDKWDIEDGDDNCHGNYENSQYAEDDDDESDSYDDRYEHSAHKVISANSSKCDEDGDSTIFMTVVVMGMCQTHAISLTCQKDVDMAIFAGTSI